MNCPICGKEMEQGVIQGNQRIAWVKSKHKISILPHEGEILLENKAFASFYFQRVSARTVKRVLWIIRIKTLRSVNTE